MTLRRIPGPFDAIQQALDAAGGGDTVLVRDGTYTGEPNQNLVFNGKDMILRSENGPDACVIDCDGYGRGFGFYYGETAAAIVEGFTVIRAGYYGGGGAWCTNSNPTIINCRFLGAIAAERGGAIWCDNSSPTLRDCVIADNLTEYYGAILLQNQSHLRLVNCRIERNSSNDGAILVYWDCSVALENCTLTDNGGKYAGAAMYAIGAQVVLKNCTIAGNVSRGSDRWALRFDDSNVTISNCVLWNNSSRSAVHTAALGNSQLHVSYSCIQDGQLGVYVSDPAMLNWGPGNLSTDPRIVRSGAHLRGDSPCINAGDPLGDYSGQSDIDAEPRVAEGRADIGADERVDADSDGLPNWWEQRFFGSSTAANPALDNDVDGLNNLAEYENGRNPQRGPITLYVDPAGSDAWDGLSPTWNGTHGPKGSLFAAVAAAERYEGDTIVLNPGVYSGRLNRSVCTSAKQVLLRSQQPADPATVAATIIDCGGQVGVTEQRCGLYFPASTPANCVVDGLTIRRGHARVGGAIYAAENAAPVIRRCVLRDCTTERGGGAYTRTGGTRFEHCRFENSHATQDGGGVWAGEWGSADFIGCQFVANSATRHGGGVYLLEHERGTFVNCIFAANQAGSLGGGGAFDQLYQPPWGTSVTNCIFTRNTAADGGAAALRDAGAYLTNCTLTDNSTARGGGVAVFGQPGLRLGNSILWNNHATSGAELAMLPAYDPAKALVTYCDVAGGAAGVYQQPGSLLEWRSTNTAADPLFIDFDGPDDDPSTWVDNNYRLVSGSPAVDSGWNALLNGDPLDLDQDGRADEYLPLDYDWSSRIVDDVQTPDHGCGTIALVDMGAFETGGMTPQPCVGEISGDGSIGLQDLALLLSNFGTSGVCLSGDLDANELVDLSDLAVMLSQFGAACD
ncbi:MAG: right-handed parallel beta-helix repeat-containing protein [Planctomycetes bacterium]|nr:right-handed parallel beta-helix repeat-containing protein [Planctomycetota bacterium]